MLIRLFRKNIYTLLLLIFISSLIPVKASAEDQLPVNFKTLSGSWTLLYGNDYGYSFKFYKNYRAVVILYLNNASIVFKGVYNIESGDSIRINVSEMKREESVKNINLKGGFVKAKSSHFIFNTRVTATGAKKNLELRPQKIFIDGSDSEGYFEPFIRLDYSGK
jgi:hypothetical protein